MKKKSVLTLCIFINLLFNFSFAQKTVEIINANSLEFDASKGVKAKKLIGNVIFKQDGIFMYCDSAYFYSEDNKLDAFSNVHIKQGDTLHIYSDSLYYDGNTKKARVRSNIKMVDPSITLTTNYLDYDLKNSIGTYLYGGKIENKKENTTLTSQYGYYYSETKYFYFKKNVTMVNENYTIQSDTLKMHSESEMIYFIGPTNILSDSSNIYCESGWHDSSKDQSFFNKNVKITNESQIIMGDTIFYEKNIGIGKIYGHAHVEDTLEKTILNGDYCWYNEKDSTTLIVGNSLYTQQFDDDTLYLHADTLFASYDSTKKYRMLFAYYKVKFFKNDMQGKCDSLVFSDVDSTIQLYFDPILWTDENQLTGDKIIIKRNSEEVEKLDIYNNAFIIMTEDTIHYNQIKGENMTAFFKENSLKKVDVLNKGETIYHVKEDEEIIGINKTICENMTIFLDSSEVKKITFFTRPEAVLYPVKDLTYEETFLANFKWLNKHRPKRKEDVFIWEIENP
jgi:lipopolysaccharide export system protein LptA